MIQRALEAKWNNARYEREDDAIYLAPGEGRKGYRGKIGMEIPLLREWLHLLTVDELLEHVLERKRLAEEA